MGFEILFNAALLLLLVIFFIRSLQFGGVTISTDFMGASGFPQIVIVISIMLALWQTYIIFKEKKIQSETSIDRKRVLLTILLFAAYMLALNPAGYIVSTVIAVFVLGKVAGYKGSVKMAFFSVILSAAIVLLFGRIFYVPLPRGVGILRELSYYIY